MYLCLFWDLGSTTIPRKDNWGGVVLRDLTDCVEGKGKEKVASRSPVKKKSSPRTEKKREKIAGSQEKIKLELKRPVPKCPMSNHPAFILVFSENCSFGNCRRFEQLCLLELCVREILLGNCCYRRIVCSENCSFLVSSFRGIVPAVYCGFEELSFRVIVVEPFVCSAWNFSAFLILDFL